MIKVWKAYEHGKIKPGDIDGKELDRLSKNAIDYIKRIQELKEQIEKRVQEKSMEETYQDIFKMLGAFLKKKSESTIIKEFDEQLIKTGKFPPRFLEGLKTIAKTKREVAKVRQDKSKKDNLTSKQSREVDNARKLASEITNAIIEYTQRREIAKMDKTRFILKGRETNAEIFFLPKTFIVQGQKIQKISNDKLIKSNLKELQEQIIAQKNKEAKIDLTAIETLKKIFGEFELVH